MRKYTGKYPNHIREIYGSYAPGIAMVKTNNGGIYYIHAKDTAGYMPKLGNDIFTYKFIRAQPMTFQQDRCLFSRILDGYPVEFVEYLVRLAEVAGQKIEQEKLARRRFIIDMVKQGILPRFSA